MQDIRMILEDGLSAQEAFSRLRERERALAKGESRRQWGERVRAAFPQQAQRTIELAEQAMRGMHVLPGMGTKPVFIGSPPRWAENPCGDNEYTFHLNRMEHWKTLCEAYSFTGDGRYAERALAEMEDWIDTIPCPPFKREDGAYHLEAFDGLSCWRALEVGIRAYRTWPFLIEHLIDSPAFTLERFQKLLGSVYTHCQVLYEISPRLWPKADHNHYLMENLGLLSFACMFPFLKGAGQWQAQALHELDRCIDNQVTGCGGQIEGCPSYHNGCVYWFSLTLVFARKYGFAVDAHYRERLQRMFAHSVYATRPCGGNSPWGDSHTALKETMSLAATACFFAFSDISYLQIARFFYPMETILEDVRMNLWMERDPGRLASQLASLTPKAPQLPLFTWQRELSQVYFRSGWEKKALSVMTACRTPVQNQHAHMDPGGFDLAAFGEPLLCDPGIYTYKECEQRRWMKSIGWHNCLNIDGKDPWEYRGSWSYGPQKPGKVLFAEASGRLCYAVSEHSNYEPALCRRALALIDGRFVLLLDRVSGLQPGEEVQVRFHFDRTELICSAGGVFSKAPGRPNLRILFSGEETPQRLPAKISTGNDRWHDSAVACFSRAMPQGGCFFSAALLIPAPAGEAFPEAQRPQASLDEDGAEASFTLGGQDYRLRWEGDRLLML